MRKGLHFKEARSLLDESHNEGIEPFESRMRKGGFGGASEKLAHYSHLAPYETPVVRVVLI